MLSRLFTGWGGVPAALEQVLPLILPLVCLPLIERLTDRKRRDWPSSALAVFCAVTAIGLAWLAQLAEGGQNAFIYFQF